MRCFNLPVTSGETGRPLDQKTKYCFLAVKLFQELFFEFFQKILLLIKFSSFLTHLSELIFSFDEVKHIVKSKRSYLVICYVVFFFWHAYVFITVYLRKNMHQSNT